MEMLARLTLYVAGSVLILLVVICLILQYKVDEVYSMDTKDIILYVGLFIE
jgi:hypothetical protein